MIRHLLFHHFSHCGCEIVFTSSGQTESRQIYRQHSEHTGGSNWMQVVTAGDVFLPHKHGLTSV